MSADAPEAIAFAVTGPIARADLPGLCDRVCRLFEQTTAPVAFCDVGSVPDQLRELVAFMGLDDVLPE